jgi:mannose-1-phosphate guanylyltransferase
LKAFLLAAGFGERLKPVTDFMPKPLVPVLNVPAICYSIMLLKDAGITDIMCNLHYKREQILDFFKRHDNFGLRIEFSIEKEILGTGGGLMNCKEYFKDGPLVYINSDIIADIELSAVIKQFNKGGAGGCLAIARSSLGSVAVNNDRIVNVRNLLQSSQKPEYDFMGIAVLSPDIFKFLVSGYSDIVETGFIHLAGEGRLGFYAHEGEWHDIGSVESYREANVKLTSAEYPFKKRLYAATGMMPRVLSESARVDKNVSITRSVIGDDCIIGNGSVVEESVLLPGSSVPESGTVVRQVILQKG